jgi:hypothetical protein
MGGNAESPGSGGALPYQHRAFHVTSARVYITKKIKVIWTCWLIDNNINTISNESEIFFPAIEARPDVAKSVDGRSAPLLLR